MITPAYESFVNDVCICIANENVISNTLNKIIDTIKTLWDKLAKFVTSLFRKIMNAIKKDDGNAARKTEVNNASKDIDAAKNTDASKNKNSISKYAVLRREDFYWVKYAHAYTADMYYGIIDAMRYANNEDYYSDDDRADFYLKLENIDETAIVIMKGSVTKLERFFNVSHKNDNLENNKVVYIPYKKFKLYALKSIKLLSNDIEKINKTVHNENFTKQHNEDVYKKILSVSQNAINAYHFLINKINNSISHTQISYEKYEDISNKIKNINDGR